VLDFELVNLRVEKSDDDQPARIMKQGSGQAYLIVRFPPQHLTEIAYFTTVADIPVSTPTGAPSDPDKSSGDETPDPPPIQAIVSGWSRLVFYVPDERLPIPWTLEELLKVMGELELSVPANALPPQAQRFRLEESIFSTLDKARLIEPALRDEIVTSSSEFSRSLASGENLSPERMISRRAGGQVIAVARARRKLRTLGNQMLGTGLTGSATLNLHEKLVGDLVAPSIPPFLLRPEPRPPSETQTALPTPYHIILSPNRAAWFHASGQSPPQRAGTPSCGTPGRAPTDGTLIDRDDWRRCGRY
jgi:hypothetical protein